MFGTRNVLDAELSLDPSKQIGEIQVLQSSDRKYVNAIRFLAVPTESQVFAEREAEVLGEIVGVETDGDWKVFRLEPGEQILGIHGSLNSAPNIRALNFTVWKARDQ